MSKTKKMGIAVLPLLFLLCMLFPVKAGAAGYSEMTIQLDDAWISGEISTQGEVDFYKFTTRKAGWVTINYQGQSVADSYVSVLNNDQDREYWKTEVYTSSDINPVTKSAEMALGPGTYYIKIWGYNNKHTGTYRLKGAFEAANNDEKTNDNDFETAMSLGNDRTVTGFLSMADRVDFFKISVPTKKRVRLIYTSYINDSYMEVWNSDKISISKKNVYSASKTNPKTYVYEETLNPGLYYIKIYPYNDSHTGKYTLKYAEKILTQKITISGRKQVVAGAGSFNLKASVSPSNTTDKTVKWTSGDTSIAWVDSSTGKVTVYNKAGKVKITASAQDESNRASVYTIVVTPKRLDRPYVSNFWGRKLYVSWGYHTGVTGYEVQYATNSKFKGAVTKKVSSGHTNRTFSKMAKKRYYVRVRAFYKSGPKVYRGPWSSGKSVKITH